MLRGFSILFAFFAMALSASENARPQGLMWNRSGLPATLPLLIKTNSGTDFFLNLRDVNSDKVVFAAYVRGGEFFQVLVPPGRFELVFASGEDWQGEAKLFGANTHLFALDQPLQFRATMSQRRGHMIDLTETSGTTLSDLAKCQRLALDPESLRSRSGQFDPLFRDPSGAPEAWPDMPAPRYEVETHVCS